MTLYTVRDQKRRVPLPPDPEDTYRTPWRRDYACVIHSPAFRRLQGKTQLFPGIESDCFRNRLTHSLEAAQIAKSIAIRLNATEEFLQLKDNGIEPEIAEIAALCHDLGHPPFGHNGEKALDNCMKAYGGFEGNAQTLRILAWLEKRELLDSPASGRTYQPQPHPSGITDRGKDLRCGLNLTARVLASTLKYDNEIRYRRRRGDALVKGYYQSERDAVEWFKKHVAGRSAVRGGFKTLECQIMDIADDIAYSTYDLEDALKAGFLIPLDLVAAKDEIIDQVRYEVSTALGGVSFSRREIRRTLARIVEPVAKVEPISKDAAKDPFLGLKLGSLVYTASLAAASDARIRVQLTSQLVQRFVEGVEFVPNEAVPPLSEVRLRDDVALEVEVLKRFNYSALIMSPLLKTAEFRGGEIVKTIFQALADSSRDGYRLLPNDFQTIYQRIEEPQRKRVICDFIAGMTDRYALEFYGRLKSENPQTIFKPL